MITYPYVQPTTTAFKADPACFERAKELIEQLSNNKNSLQIDEKEPDRFHAVALNESGFWLCEYYSHIAFGIGVGMEEAMNHNLV